MDDIVRPHLPALIQHRCERPCYSVEPPRKRVQDPPLKFGVTRLRHGGRSRRHAAGCSIIPKRALVRTCGILRDRAGCFVRARLLDPLIGVRIPAPEPLIC